MALGLPRRRSPRSSGSSPTGSQPRATTAEIEPTVVVNPEIRIADHSIEEGWEGCLSIPGLRGLVPRARRIKLRGRTIGR